MSPYSQSRPVATGKTRDETPDEHEERTWRERAHTDAEGIVFIPPMALKNCLAEAAKYKSIQIPGKGKATYTKHFEAGIMVLDPVSLGVSIDDVRRNKIFVPSDGRRGSGKRVWKSFPTIDQWKATAWIYVLDDVIDEEVFRQHLEDAGQFIGIGSFRPRNNGFFGRFRVTKISWSNA